MFLISGKIQTICAIFHIGDHGRNEMIAIAGGLFALPGKETAERAAL